MAWQDFSEGLREMADAIDREAPLIAEIVEAARELLAVYIEGNGGMPPTDAKHPARRLMTAFEKVEKL